MTSIAGELDILNWAGRIRQRLLSRGDTIADAIQDRSLYFRISVLGACNLSCPFCHNEGGPTKGKLDVLFATDALRIAHGLGFGRVQFTGGEPLLHPDIGRFIAEARRIVRDVGITTNGTYLPKRLDELIAVGLYRIHVSLQAEALRSQNSLGWLVPSWLMPVLQLGRQNVLKVRLNLPVLLSDLPLARDFLVELSEFGCDVSMFSILPHGTAACDYPTSALDDLAVQENTRRMARRTPGQVFVRGYRAPTGLRCAACAQKSACKEQSHSLRLGADRVLRPCLATRKWDIDTADLNLHRAIELGTLLALDYIWPDGELNASSHDPSSTNG
jgi:molybdenum cofactor biosynthesis enzyme MoaA